MGGVISGKKRDASGRLVSDRWFLPAPLKREYWRGRLKSFGLADHEEVLDFFEFFGGLAEDTFTAGSFRYCEEEWPVFAPGKEVIPGWDWPESINDFPEWHGALVFYQAADGGKLLLRADGATAWWVMQESRVERFAVKFEDFVGLYSGNWSRVGPFDYYSSRIR